MTQPTVYLDTSAINFLFADDAPEKQAITIEFFDNFVKTKAYEVFVSDFVLAEINQTTDEDKRQRLLQVLKDYPIEFLELDDPDEIDQLAEIYLSSGVMPPKKLFDALHVAVCVCLKIDYLVSWNYKHLANVNREKRILAANYQHNYFHPLRIITPTELIFYGN